MKMFFKILICTIALAAWYVVTYFAGLFIGTKLGNWLFPAE